MPFVKLRNGEIKEVSSERAIQLIRANEAIPVNSKPVQTATATHTKKENRNTKN